MKKIILVFAAFIFSSTVYSNNEIKNNDTINKDIKNNEIKKDEACRVCCTVSVPDGYGNLVGSTACAGSIFTSCETAGENACKKAGKKSIEAIFDL
jgi:hypothetical protein